MSKKNNNNSNNNSNDINYDDFFDTEKWMAKTSDFNNLTTEEIPDINFEELKRDIELEIENYLEKLATIYFKKDYIENNEFILSKIRRDSKSTARIEVIIKICEELLFEIKNRIHKKEIGTVNELLRAAQTMSDMSKTLRDLQNSSDIQFREYEKSYKMIRFDIDNMKELEEIEEQKNETDTGKLVAGSKQLTDLAEIIKKKL